MRVVQHAVADRVGDHWVADVVVPLCGRELAGHDRRAGPEAVVEDLVEVSAFLLLEWRDAPVVDDQHVDARETLEQLAVGAVGAGEDQLVGKAGCFAVAKGLKRAPAL